MADTQRAGAELTASGKRPRSVRVVILALMIAMMLAMLDNMIVGTAMPTIDIPPIPEPSPGAPVIASPVVVDPSLAATSVAVSAPPAGAFELQGVEPERVTLIGAVLGGTHPGRRDEREITVYKSTGHASLDLAAAAVVRASLG